MSMQTIERHNNSVGTPSESHSSEYHQGEPNGSPIFVFERLIFTGGVTGGVTKWGYIFGKLGLHIWGNRGG